MGVPQNTGPSWIDEGSTGAIMSGSAQTTPWLTAAHSALYFFQTTHETGGSNINGSAVYKSSDQGNTWAKLDGASSPTSKVGSAVYDPVGDRFICALVTDTFPQSQQTILLKDFSCTSETWGADYATGGPLAQTLVQAVFLRPDGSIVAIYDLGSGNNPGGTSRMRAAVWDGLAWGSPIDIGVAIIPFQASGNILGNGLCSTMDPVTGVIHLAFGDNTATDFIYQAFLANNTLGQSDHFTAASLGISGNSFRNIVLFGGDLYIPFPANSFTDNSVLVGSPSSAPSWSQSTPAILSQPAGFVNRAGNMQADSTTLYWMVSFFDQTTGTYIAFQLFISTDGVTWATAPGNDSSTWFYDFEPGGSVQAPHTLPIFGVQVSTFSLLSGGGISTAYGFAEVQNSLSGFAQSYLMNLQQFGSGPAALALSGTPPNGTVGVSYGFCFTASGGTTPYAFSITSGSIPPGTTLDPLTGCITGTPTTAGTFCFRITVTDADLSTAFLDRCITIVAGSLIVQLIGWKLYPEVPCDEPLEAREVPHVKMAF